MSQVDPPASPSPIGKHGIVVIHGAGMPENDKTIVGDPLSTIANGLVDAFTTGLFGDKYRLAMTGIEKDHDLDELNLTLYGKGDPVEKPLHAIRMREVLWKPTIRKMNPADFIPLLWQWAFAFESHTVRKAAVDTQNRKGEKPDNVENNSQAERRAKEFWGRFFLAALGIAATFLWTGLAGEIVKLLNPQWDLNGNEFKQVWRVTTTLNSISITSGILLFLLALDEWINRAGKAWKRAKPNTPNGRMHMFGVIVTTAWLAPFVLPLLLVVYYLDKLLVLLLGIALSAGAIFIVLAVDNWILRVAFLVAVAFGFWAISKLRLPARGFVSPIRSDIHSPLAQYLTTLLVSGGAPVIITIIRLLNLFAFLPLFGDKFQKLAQSISDSGMWTVVKDIHMFVTDSSRSAAIRYSVEEEIIKVAEQAEHVHVMAHSLGTVVAYETLAQIGNGNGALIKKGDATYNKIRTLVTYGAPLNKIRILANKTAESKNVLSGMDYTRFWNGAKLPADFTDFHWANFYSFQDIVSDVLTLYGEPVPPKNYATASADDLITAHGAYWYDKGFWRTAFETMGLA